jgi:hypothetical protein
MDDRARGVGQHISQVVSLAAEVGGRHLTNLGLKVLIGSEELLAGALDGAACDFDGLAVPQSGVAGVLVRSLGFLNEVEAEVEAVAGGGDVGPWGGRRSRHL